MFEFDFSIEINPNVRARLCTDQIVIVATTGNRLGHRVTDPNQAQPVNLVRVERILNRDLDQMNAPILVKVNQTGNVASENANGTIRPIHIG